MGYGNFASETVCTSNNNKRYDMFYQSRTA